MSRVVRVLALLPSLDTGGAETYFLRLVAHSKRQPIRWSVMCPDAHCGELKSEALARGCQIRSQALGYVNVFELVRFYRFLRRESFDVVVSFNGIFSGIPLFVGRLAGVKRRIACHRRSTHAFSPGLLRNAYAVLSTWLVERISTRVLSNSRAALDFFHGDGWRLDPLYRVIPNGIDARPFASCSLTKRDARGALGIPVDAFVVGHVGRLDPAKNHATIFKVAKKVATKCPGAVFVFCGKGTDSETMHQMLRRNELEGTCICLGLQKNMPLVYRAFDMFFFPSITEGQPNALIEAMVAGLPIVSSDIPAVRETVAPELREELLPPEDHNLASERILAIAFEESVRRKSMQRWAIEQYDPHRNFHDFIQELVPNGPTAQVT